jgi:malate synthase
MSTTYVRHGSLNVAAELDAFVRDEAAPGTGVTPHAFWAGVEGLLADFAPKNRVLLARRDDLTTVRNAERVHDMVRNCGVEVETWIADGTHSFDEPMTAPPMRYDAELCDEAIRRFAALLEDTATAPTMS